MDELHETVIKTKLLKNTKYNAQCVLPVRFLIKNIQSMEAFHHITILGLLKMKNMRFSPSLCMTDTRLWEALKPISLN